MTDFQARQIRELRMRGQGYWAIASEVGLSRDIVRNYCKKQGLDGYANVLTENFKEQMADGKVCLCCGREIIQPANGRRRKFCSDKCRRTWWAAHPEKINRKRSTGKARPIMRPPTFTAERLSRPMGITSAVIVAITAI